METITNNAVAEMEPDNFLAESLANTPGVDTHGYGTQPKADENPTLKTDTQDRGTEDPAVQETTTSNEVDKTSATTSETETKTQPVGKVKSRAPDRIQELLAQVKERDTKLAEYEKAKATVTAQQSTQEAPKQVETPVMTPKPEYDAATLQGVLDKKEMELEEHRINGDLPKVKETLEFMRAIRGKLQEAQTWEARNKQASDQYNAAVQHYRNEVLKTWPDMGKDNSPIRQEHGKVFARFQEMQKNPALLEHELASIASLRVRVAGMAALEETNKQLQQKLTELTAKQKPLKQDEAQTTSEARESDNPDADLLRSLKQVLPKGRR